MCSSIPMLDRVILPQFVISTTSSSMKSKKNDYLVLDKSFKEMPFSDYIKNPTSIGHKILLHYTTAMTTYLVNSCNMQA